MAVRVQLVVNPDAGRYHRDKVQALRDAFRRQGAAVTLTHFGPGRQLLIEDDAQLMVVVGGDGTFRHAATTLLASGRDLPLTFYPMGTINLLQLEVERPTAPDQFAHVALSKIKAEDHVPATINRETFYACASAGPDALAVATVSTRLKSWIGRYAYLVSMLRLVQHWRRPQLTIIADGRPYHCEAVYVAKGTYFAGPYSFAPEAARTSDRLYVLALKRATRLDYWHFLRGMLRGTILADAANYIRLDCKTLDILCSDPWPVQADGDPIATLPVRIQISDKRLRFH
jgi:diacylglycerol kinase (ATP)